MCTEVAWFSLCPLVSWSQSNSPRRKWFSYWLAYSLLAVHATHAGFTFICGISFGSGPRNQFVFSGRLAKLVTIFICRTYIPSFSYCSHAVEPLTF